MEVTAGAGNGTFLGSAGRRGKEKNRSFFKFSRYLQFLILPALNTAGCLSPQGLFAYGNNLISLVANPPISAWFSWRPLTWGRLLNRPREAEGTSTYV
ncbi:Centrosomal Protein Of 76 Kda [Manis pentadactyla]|nr:Centrosomal Protein Of 76 Kda [Manis pentadactyla]